MTDNLTTANACKPNELNEKALEKCMALMNKASYFLPTAEVHCGLGVLTKLRNTAGPLHQTEERPPEGVMAKFYGIPIIVEDAFPDGYYEMRDKDGKVLAYGVL